MTIRINFIQFSAFFALVLSSCSHPTTVDRTPSAVIDVLRTNYEADINLRSTPGSYEVDFRAQYPFANGLDFATVVEAFRGNKVSSAISATLSDQKAFPLNLLRTQYAMKEVGPGKIEFLVTAYVKNLKWASSTESKLSCTDQLKTDSGRGYWKQECKPVMDYKDTDKYMSAFHQTLECTERSGGAECHFLVSGTMKKISVPGVAKALLGQDDFSPSQAAYKSAENLLHSYYAYSQLMNYPPPLVQHTGVAVANYRKSEDYKLVMRIAGKFPKSGTDVSNVHFAAP